MHEREVGARKIVGVQRELLDVKAHRERNWRDATRMLERATATTVLPARSVNDSPRSGLKPAAPPGEGMRVRASYLSCKELLSDERRAG